MVIEPFAPPLCSICSLNSLCFHSHSNLYYWTLHFYLLLSHYLYIYHIHTHRCTHVEMYAFTYVHRMCTHAHTPANPAVSPQADTVEAQVGNQTKLAVFVSTINGPLPENRLRWYWPSGEEVQSSDPRVTFQTSRRRLTLSGLTTNDSGSYVCEALHIVDTLQFFGSTTIQLKVFGECGDMFV